MTKKSTAKAPAAKKAAAPAAKPAVSTAAKSAAAKPAPAADSGKIAKAQIVEQLSTRTNLTKKDAGRALDAALEVIVDALKSGKTVGLPGIGTFGVKATAARTGVRPGTSEKIQIPAGKKVSFKVASDLKKSI